MAPKAAETGTLARLLRLKSDLGQSPRQQREPDELSTALVLRRLTGDLQACETTNDHPTRLLCINCGYSQQGVRMNACPECGLPLAAFYHDPTPWGAAQSLFEWWATATKVWSWNARIRLRSSLIPATPAAHRFALWSILVTAVLGSLAFAVGHADTRGSSRLLAGVFVVQLIEALVLIGLALLGVVYGMMRGMRSTWRRRYRFAPGSIYYATAWWPPTVATVLLLTVAYRCCPVPDVFALLVVAAGFGLAQWGAWLWISLTDSQCVTLPGLRIGLVVLVCSVAGSLGLAAVPGSSQWAASRVLVGESGLARVQTFRSFAPGPRPAGPKTYAVIIDAIPDAGSAPVLQVVERMGANRPYIVMNGDEATLFNIERAFEALRKDVRRDDRVILYINGHGARDGAGAIRVANGLVTSQKVRDLVRDMRTPHVLLMIESCYAGKFIQALRGQSAVVLTATDDKDLAFGLTLRPFWKALLDPDTDVDGTGRVLLSDAFWGAYGAMLQGAEDARINLLTRSHTDWLRYRDEAYSMPQLEVLGLADDTEFFVEVPKTPPDGAR